MKKIFTFTFCFLLFAITRVTAQSFNCSYDGTICNKAIGSFCPGVPDSDLVSFCIPKNSLTCDNSYDCSVFDSPIPTPNPCSSVGFDWDCQPANLVGTFNCNSTNPSACNPNDPPTCAPSLPDPFCTGGWICCGPSLLYNTPIPFLSPTPKLIPFFCDSSGHPTTDVTPRVDTGLGCVPYAANNFTAKFLAWAAVTNLGIAFIIMLIAISMLISSGGDAKKIQAAKELLMSAFGGIFLIVISVVLINYLGVNVLKLSI